jgi:hypothetical protein
MWVGRFFDGARADVNRRFRPEVSRLPKSRLPMSRLGEPAARSDRDAVVCQAAYPKSSLIAHFQIVSRSV